MDMSAELGSLRDLKTSGSSRLGPETSINRKLSALSVGDATLFAESREERLRALLTADQDVDRLLTRIRNSDLELAAHAEAEKKWQASHTISAWLVLRPGSKVLSFWDIIIVTIVIISALFIPLDIAFKLVSDSSDSKARPLHPLHPLHPIHPTPPTARRAPTCNALQVSMAILDVLFILRYVRYLPSQVSMAILDVLFILDFLLGFRTAYIMEHIVIRRP